MTWAMPRVGFAKGANLWAMNRAMNLRLPYGVMYGEKSACWVMLSSSYTAVEFSRGHSLHFVTGQSILYSVPDASACFSPLRCCVPCPADGFRLHDKQQPFGGRDNGCKCLPDPLRLVDHTRPSELYKVRDSDRTHIEKKKQAQQTRRPGASWIGVATRPAFRPCASPVHE